MIAIKKGHLDHQSTKLNKAILNQNTFIPKIDNVSDNEMNMNKFPINRNLN